MGRIIALLLFGLPFLLSGQLDPNKLFFNNIDCDGLPSFHVAFVEDGEDKVWIFADKYIGLIDGEEVIPYPKLTDFTKLGTPFIHYIDDDIYISSLEGGVVKTSINDPLKNLNFCYFDPDSSALSLSAMVKLNEKIYCLDVIRGLGVMDASRQNIHFIYTIKKRGGSSINFNHQGMTADPLAENKLWISGDDGFYHVDLEKMRHDFYPVEPDESDDLILRKLCYDGKDHIFAPAWGRGIYTLNIRNHETKNIRWHKDDHWGALMKNITYTIETFSSGHCLVGTGKDVVIVNTTNGNCTFFPISEKTPGSLEPSLHFQAFEDHQNGLWVHSDTKIFHASHIDQHMKTIALGNDIYRDLPVYTMQNDYVDKNKYRVSSVNYTYTLTKDGKASLINNNYEVFPKSGNQYFAFQVDNIVELTKTGNQEYKIKGGLGQLGRRDVVRDHYGNIWYSLHGAERRALVKLDTNGVSHEYWPHSRQNFSLNQYTFTVLEDDDNRLWVGTAEELRYTSLDTIDFKTFHIPFVNESESRLFAHQLEKDTTGMLWLASRQGAYQIDPRQMTFRPLDELVKLDFKVQNFVSDYYGRLWFSHDKKIWKYNPYTNEISVFSSSQGIQPGRICALYDSTMAIIGEKALQIFHPDSLTALISQPRPYVKRFYIYDSLAHDVFYLLKNDSVVVNHDQNAFTFHYGAFDYIANEDLIFEYKLGGFDNAWRRSLAGRKASYTNIPPREYRFVVRVRHPNSKVWIESHPVMLSIIPAYYQTTWFMYFVITSISLMLWSIYRYRLVMMRKEEQLKTEFNKSLAELEMTALRSQMNPHFIFNSLNSIRNYVINRPKEEAATYLTKFSQLMRVVLENSKSNLLSVEQELKMLRLYVELEQKRFNDYFDFEFVVDPLIEQDDTFIPPMLIQPHIENAIWHGLMHKEGDKKLRIEFQFLENHILCIIEDNGIGRKKSEEINKNRRRENRKSLGTQITQKRSEIIESTYGTKVRIDIQNLEDTLGNATGTRVIVLLPILHH